MAVRTWVDLAFQRSWEEDPKKLDPDSNPDMLLIFVRFYWKLYQRKDDAERYLDNERKRLGFRFFVFRNSRSSPVNSQLQRKKHHPSLRHPIAKQRVLYPGARHAPPQRSAKYPNTQAHREHIHGNTLKRKRLTKQYRGGFEGDKASRIQEVVIRGCSASLLDASHSQNNPRHFEVPPILPATSYLEKSRTIPFPSTSSHPLSNILPDSGSLDTLELRSQIDSGLQNAPFSSLSSSHAVINGWKLSSSTESHDSRLPPSPAILDTSNNLETPETMQKMHPASDSDRNCLIPPGPETLNSVPPNSLAQTREAKISPTHKFTIPVRPPIWAQVECGFLYERHYYYRAYSFSFSKSRQEVCESFDWFRSYQGGVYHVHNVARGYLLSAFSSW